jgi:N-acyl homoserine lactone hydrolase
MRIHDEHLYRRSLDEIRRYLRDTPTALAIPGHDPSFWPELDDLYE